MTTCSKCRTNPSRSYHAWCSRCYNSIRAGYRATKKWIDKNPPPAKQVKQPVIKQVKQPVTKQVKQPVTKQKEDLRGMTTRAIEEVKRLDSGILIKLDKQERWEKIADLGSHKITENRTMKERLTSMEKSVIMMRREMIIKMGDWNPMRNPDVD